MSAATNHGAGVRQTSIRHGLAIVSVAALVGTMVCTAPTKASDGGAAHAVGASASAPVSGLSPIFGVAVPGGYRQWELIAPDHRPDLGELRSVLGNPVAVRAYRSGTLPFPDGAVLVKLAWKYIPAPEPTGAFVPGPATTVQVMVKDSGRYAATGGWGFGRFVDGKPADEAQHRTCFACHEAFVRNHDWVFTRFAP